MTVSLFSLTLARGAEVPVVDPRLSAHIEYSSRVDTQDQGPALRADQPADASALDAHPDNTSESRDTDATATAVLNKDSIRNGRIVYYEQIKMAFPNLGHLAATTIEYRSKDIADNVTQNNAALKVMKEKGGFSTFDGGTFINENL
jgi:hypothetical protein